MKNTTFIALALLFATMNLFAAGPKVPKGRQIPTPVPMIEISPSSPMLPAISVPVIPDGAELAPALEHLDLSLESMSASLAAMDASPANGIGLYDDGTPLPLEDHMAAEGKESPNDPAYTIYKEGYSLILDENWDAARKKFADVLKKHPKSEYADDATYWSAYALKHIDRKKAIQEYKDFIAKYPKSSYYDDAIADLSQLKGKSTSWSSSGLSGTTVWSDDGDSSNVTILAPSTAKVYNGRKGFAYRFDSNMGAATRRLKRELSRIPGAIRMPRMPRTPMAPRAYNLMPMVDEDKLDERTRLKMDALHALGDTKEDSLSFKTLRDVAVDKKQPRELRLTAIDALSNFRKFDPLPVFIQIAKNDTDADIQNTAIDVISDLGGEKNRSVEALIDLYNALPKGSKDQRESIFYSIADIGNDKAVDFLASVAKSSDDYDLRSQAIYYLGNIGGEKARAALYDVLKEN